MTPEELAAEVLRLKSLLADARSLIEPWEWADDRGRECPWCGATIHTFNRAEHIGTERERRPRDNHREDCRFLAFIRACPEAPK